jgi:hypothetical protein
LSLKLISQLKSGGAARGIQSQHGNNNFGANGRQLKEV